MSLFDSQAPPGTGDNPLGWKADEEPTYLLGVACGCGRSSMVVALALERQEPLTCPACGDALL